MPSLPCRFYRYWSPPAFLCTCHDICIDYTGTHGANAHVGGRSSYPCRSRRWRQKLLRRDKCRQGSEIARAILRSGFAARHKRTGQEFDGTAKCTGIHEARITLTWVVNRRARAVLVMSRGKSSYAMIHVGEDTESPVPCCNRAPRLDTSVYMPGVGRYVPVYRDT